MDYKNKLIKLIKRIIIKNIKIQKEKIL